MIRPATWMLGVLLSQTGCSARLLRLENDLLQRQNDALRAELDGLPMFLAGQPAPVDMELLERYIEQLGMPAGERTSETAILVPINGHNTDFGVFFQFFEAQQVLYIATHDYLRIEDADSPRSMVLLLTRLATMNYDMLLGKLQLNPRSGAISLSMEIHIRDGLSFDTFSGVVGELIEVADSNYPVLLRASQESSF